MSETPDSSTASPGEVKPQANAAAPSGNNSESGASQAAATPRAIAITSRSRGGSIMLTLLLLMLIAGLVALAWFTFEQRNVLVSLQSALAGERNVSPAQITAIEQAQRQTLARVAEAESALQQLQGVSQQTQIAVQLLQDAVQQAGTAMQQLQASLLQSQTSVQQLLQQTETEMQQTLQQTETEAQQTLQQEQQAIEQTLAETRTRLAEQAERLDGISRELVATNLRMNDSGAGGSQAWMLNEAESLLRLARQRILVARDVRSAIGLFIAVDDLLRQLDDASVFAVREVLAQELATLQALPEVDVEGLYVQLGAQMERVDSIGVAARSDNQDFSVPAPGTGGAADAAANWLAGAKQALGRYFVVSQRDEAVMPLMTDEQQYLIRRGIQLQIEQARLALLRGEPEIYRQALDEAINAISQRLEDEDGNRDALTAALAALRDETIVVSIPSSNTALSAIRQLVPTAAEGPAEEGL